MKKLYLITLLGLGVAVNAQNQKFPAAKAPAQPAAKIKTNDYVAPSPVRVNNKPATPQGGYGKNATWTKVGTTNFDRQTNSSVYRRVLAHADGKVSVIWTTSTDGPENSYLGRGTGYNHFNGTTWGTISPLRIEANRAGYPNFDFNGTTEIIMSHRVDTNGKSGGLLYNTNGSVGSTTWTTTTVLGEVSPTKPTVLWPRTVISGNYMHVLASYTDASASQPDTVKISGVKDPTVYSRYNFSNSTWEITNITLPGFDSTRWFQGAADGYAIDANGANVAVILGGSSSDITLWKSDDNGDTWDMTIIDSFPVPAFNDQETILDTPVVTDGSLAIKVDASGNAHCFWGRLRVLNTVANDNTSSVFLGTNSIDYWYEGRPDSIVSIAGAMDGNGSGELEVGTIDERSRYGNAGVATMPYVVTNTNGDIYVVYSALTEEDLDAQGAAYRDVYVVFSKDNGATWSEIQNLTSIMGFNREQMFASAAIANGILHLTFMESDLVGFFDATSNAGKVGPFDIMYYSIPLSQIDDMKVGLNETANNLFTIDQNYPNPFSKSTIIPVKLTDKADVTVNVMNMVGQVVYTQTFTNTPSGINELEISNDFKPGVYFYNVEAGGFKASGKMIAQ